MISNGNRTEWSPVRSVIIRVITKSDDRAAGVRFVYPICLSYYQLIIKITISEKKKNSQVMKIKGSCEQRMDECNLVSVSKQVFV